MYSIHLSVSFFPVRGLLSCGWVRRQAAWLLTYLSSGAICFRSPLVGLGQILIWNVHACIWCAGVESGEGEGEIFLNSQYNLKILSFNICVSNCPPLKTLFLVGFHPIISCIP